MSTLFISIRNRQQPFPMGVDESSRVMVSCNYDLELVTDGIWEYDIARYLQQKGKGTAGVNLFVGQDVQLPNTDDDTVLTTLLNTGGLSPINTHNGTYTARPTLQVVTRAQDYEPAMRHALSILRDLQSVRHVEVAD